MHAYESQIVKKKLLIKSPVMLFFNIKKKKNHNIDTQRINILIIVCFPS